MSSNISINKEIEESVDLLGKMENAAKGVEDQAKKLEGKSGTSFFTAMDQAFGSEGKNKSKGFFSGIQELISEAATESKKIAFQQDQAKQAAEERKARQAYFDDDDDWEEIEIEEEYDPEPFDTAAIANKNQEFKDKSAAFQKKQNTPTKIDPLPIKQISTGVSVPPYLQKAVPPPSNE